MMGRRPLGDADLRRYFPFLVLLLDVSFVIEHALFTFANWARVLPEEREKFDPKRAPFVTVMIPTYNEGLAVVEATLRAALRISYPADRLRVLLLDDGGSNLKRNLVKRLRAENSKDVLAYFSRARENLGREGFKAGNLNFGLSKASPETEAYLILDADHVPVPGILEDLVPYGFRDGVWNENFGFVQAPQTYQRDPIDIWDRPCREFHMGTQAYRAYRNAVMQTGTGTLINAKAIRALGGFDQRTVTEDLMTGIQIQNLGYQTYYHPKPVAHGLVPDIFRDILKQRLRWAQGSFQLLKLWRTCTRKLSLGQKLTYLSGIFHFLMAFPNLMLFFLPPLIIIGDADACLQYSNSSLALLGLFIGTRYFSRSRYSKKTLVEKASANFITYVYSPVYVYALFSAFIKKSLVFWTTPKGLEAGKTPLHFVDSLFEAMPFVIATANLVAVGKIFTATFVYRYPLKSLMLNYLGMLILATYFAICGLMIEWLAPRAHEKGQA